MSGPLSGKVAVVTGASRGIGKGTAEVLGGLGAKVYVTGRTLNEGDHDLPGTIGSTAAEVTRRGGEGVPLAVDVLEDEQLADLFARVKKDDGRLDILVNNAIAIPEAMTMRAGFWEKPLDDELRIFDTGARAVFVASWHAANIMVPQGSGLIASMSGYVGTTYTYDVAFGTAKSAVDRMMRDMGVELKGTGVAAISLWQGFTYTERAKRNLEKVEGMAASLNSAAGSSPEFPGRVIAALAQDPKISARNGGTFINAELAEDYGVTDVDGRRIQSLRDERGAPIWGPVG